MDENTLSVREFRYCVHQSQIPTRMPARMLPARDAHRGRTRRARRLASATRAYADSTFFSRCGTFMYKH